MTGSDRARPLMQNASPTNKGTNPISITVMITNNHANTHTVDKVRRWYGTSTKKFVPSEYFGSFARPTED